MSFADTYLRRYASARIKDLIDPDPGLAVIVVIPVYNEPDLGMAIDSLLAADPPGCSWEIIAVVNEPQHCPVSHSDQNLQTIRQLEDYIATINRNDLSVHFINPEPLPVRKAGPGLARKIGMDEALRRFNKIGRPDGIIASYDADTLCSANYLKGLFSFYESHPDAAGCTVYFEHPAGDENFDSMHHQQGIIQYELYLRYFRWSLAWMGFPYSCYSLGSAFSVRADRYAIAGGMGLQQAGEDFYFLQKCLPLGNFWEMNTVSVFPSPRFSDRVVFGTGPRIEKYTGEREEFIGVYQFKLFEASRPLFEFVNKLKDITSQINAVEEITRGLDYGIGERTRELGWPEKIERAINESAGINSFRRRFYQEINLLQVIRLFNLMEFNGFPKKPVAGEYRKFLNKLSVKVYPSDPGELLHFARGKDRNRGDFQIV